MPIQFVNPLCSTLKELKLSGEYGCDNATNECGYAFAMRHLPKLEIAELSEVHTIKVVKLLYQIRTVNQEGFEEAWRTGASRLGLDVESPSFFSGNNELLLHHFLYFMHFTLFYMTGMLSVKKLERVPINDPCSLQAVSSFCSCELEMVEFVEIRDDSPSSSDISEERIDKGNEGERAKYKHKLADELEIIAKNWSTVRIFLQYLCNLKSYW